MQIIHTLHENPQSTFKGRIMFVGGYALLVAVEYRPEEGERERVIVEYVSVEPLDHTAAHEELQKFLERLPRECSRGAKICIPKEGLPTALVKAAIDEWYDDDDWDDPDYLTRVVV